MFRVSGIAHNFKVLDAIVQSVMVLVMDNLRRFQPSTKKLLHHIAMFSDVIIVDSDESVTLLEGNAAFPIAVLDA